MQAQEKEEEEDKAFAVMIEAKTTNMFFAAHDGDRIRVNFTMHQVEAFGNEVC